MTKLIRRLLLWGWSLIKDQVVIDLGNYILPKVSDRLAAFGSGQPVIDAPVVTGPHSCGHESTSYAIDPHTHKRVCHACHQLKVSR